MTDSPIKNHIYDEAARVWNPGKVALLKDQGIDIVLGDRSGYIFQDVEGQPLINLHINGGVFNLGHCNPEVRQALVEGSLHYDAGNHYFPSQVKNDLCEALLSVSPDHMKYVAFNNGGGESIDAAVKFARHATGRRRVVTVNGAFHGATGIATQAEDPGMAAFFTMTPSPDEFSKVDYDDLDQLEEVLRREDTAAMLIESMPATAGFPVPHDDYLAGVTALAHRYGALYIDDEWATFLADNGFLVGLSMDGPAEDHDAYRVNRAGRPTHDQVLRGWKILRAHGVETNILCTVHAANADHPLEVYRYFRDELGATYLQFIPIVERTSRKLLPLADAGWHEPGEARPLYTQKGRYVTERSVGPEQWGRFMSAIWDEWVVRDVGQVYVQHFDTALGNAMGQYSMCVHSPTCGDAVAVLHNGDVYACDHYVEPDYARGNIAEVSLRDVLDSTEQRQFGTDKATTLSQQCQDCPVKWACWGGCPKDRFVPVDGGRHQQNYLCAGYYDFFSHITPDIQRMAQLIRMGRPPAAIMRLSTTRR